MLATDPGRIESGIATPGREARPRASVPGTVSVFWRCGGGRLDAWVGTGIGGASSEMGESMSVEGRLEGLVGACQVFLAYERKRKEEWHIR
jgi:hypothetical protein